MLFRKLKSAIAYTNYGIACCEEAMEHYGEPPLTGGEKFCLWVFNFAYRIIEPSSDVPEEIKNKISQR